MQFGRTPVSKTDFPPLVGSSFPNKFPCNLRGPATNLLETSFQKLVSLQVGRAEHKPNGNQFLKQVSLQMGKDNQKPVGNYFPKQVSLQFGWASQKPIGNQFPKQVFSSSSGLTKNLAETNFRNRFPNSSAG